MPGWFPRYWFLAPRDWLDGSIWLELNYTMLVSPLLVSSPARLVGWLGWVGTGLDQGRAHRDNDRRIHKDENLIMKLGHLIPSSVPYTVLQPVYLAHILSFVHTVFQPVSWH